MKSTFIQDLAEYTIDLRGESWTQGSRIMGSLKLKPKAELDLSTIGVYLAHVNSKKFKAKDNKAFKIIQEKICEEDNTRFQFQLPKDCPITETTGGLYIVCGQKDKFFDGGHIELKVTPHKIIKELIQIFEFQYRFTFKALKNKAGFLETIVKMPDAKKYTSVQQLKLQMKMQEDTLSLKFLFKLKKIDFSSSSLGAIDEQLEIVKELTPEDYQIYGDAINQEGICKHIDEVLDKAKLKSFL